MGVMNGLSSLEQPRFSPSLIPFSIGVLPQLGLRPRTEADVQAKRDSFFEQVSIKHSILEAIQATYVVDDRDAVAEYISANQLSEFLVRSAKHVATAFGESRIKKLKILEDDEGTKTLFCLVAYPGSLNDAQQALEMFDQDWWLKNARHFASKLNFDFELI
jgi:hypothetical protein